MNKAELMDLVLPEGWKGHVDSAIPLNWSRDRDEKLESLNAVNEDIHPNYAWVWSYLGKNNLFGKPINLLELLALKIEKGELKVLPMHLYEELIKSDYMIGKAIREGLLEENYVKRIST